MDLHQLNDTAFLALWGLILTNAAIGSTAIPQLVDKYLEAPATPQARAITIIRVRRVLNATIALQVVIACAAVRWDMPVLQFGLGLYVALDTFLAIRTKKNGPSEFWCGNQIGDKNV